MCDFWGELMDAAEYKKCLEEIGYGKRVHTTVYVYWGAGTQFGEALDLLLAGLVKRYEISPDYNVLKFRTDELKISFLCYPDCISSAHTVLLHAITVDLVTGKVRHTAYN
jgi:hypothetical protein